MTEQDLKQYAFTGILVRIHAEEEKLQKQKDKKQIAIIEKRLEKLQADADELLHYLRQSL